MIVTLYSHKFTQFWHKTTQLNMFNFVEIKYMLSDQKFLC